MRYLRFAFGVGMALLLLGLIVSILDFVNSTHTPYRSDYDWRPRTSAANARVWTMLVLIATYLAIGSGIDYYVKHRKR